MSGPVDSREAALARRSIARARVTPGDRVAIVGAGSLAAAVSTALAEAGIQAAAAPGTADAAALSGLTVLLETTGEAAVILRLLEEAPPFARIALLGAGQGGTLDVDLYRTVHQRGIEVIGVADA
jgi:D-arabinose 1-dehydrogenase-like Zn-dependent alcohol dehydrogenase